MFGSRDDALYARVQELEGRVEHLTGRLGTLLDDEDSYMGGFVRPGEYWMAATHRTGMKAGFECIFTPLF